MQSPDLQRSIPLLHQHWQQVQHRGRPHQELCRAKKELRELFAEGRQAPCSHGRCCPGNIVLQGGRGAMKWH